MYDYLAVKMGYIEKKIEQLKFLRPVMATTKSRDRISTQNNDLDDSVSLPENELPLKKRL